MRHHPCGLKNQKTGKMENGKWKMEKQPPAARCATSKAGGRCALPLVPQVKAQRHFT